jgi:hypothetical protein
MVERNLRRGEARVYLPAMVTPDDADPFIGGRSPDGHWGVVAHLRLLGDVFSICDLEVWPWDGEESAALGTDVVRRLPLGRWLTFAHGRLAELASTAIREGHAHEELRRLSRSKVQPAAGRRGFGADFYRRLALEYLELQEQGVSRGIRAELARRESRRQGRTVTEINVRDALSKATELGFLSRGAPGRAGRTAGPNLFQDTDKEEEE